MKIREDKITIRFNHEELAILKERAKIFDGNVSRFARSSIDGVIRGNSIPKADVVWFIQKILSDPELRKNKKLTKYIEEVFGWL